MEIEDDGRSEKIVYSITVIIVIIIVIIIGLILTNIFLSSYLREESWMSDLADILQNKSLSSIVIPGSQDAGMGVLSTPLRAVNDDDVLSVVAHALLYGIAFSWLRSLAPERLMGLSKSQKGKVYDQLMAGSRFLDCCIHRDDETGDIVTSKVIVGQMFEDIAADVVKFLERNPNEIVIIHERKRTGFESEMQYLEFLKILHELFGNLLVPNDYDASVTYGELMTTPHRVIYITSIDNIPPRFVWCSATIESTDEPEIVLPDRHYFTVLDTSYKPSLARLSYLAAFGGTLEDDGFDHRSSMTQNLKNIAKNLNVVTLDFVESTYMTRILIESNI